MLLKSLHMQRPYYPTTGPLTGTIEFEAEHGKVELRLTEAACEQILRIVAGGMVDAAREVAEELTANIITAASPMLEHKG